MRRARVWVWLLVAFITGAAGWMASALGWSAVAGVSLSVAKVLLCVFIVLCVVGMFHRWAGPRMWPPVP